MSLLLSPEAGAPVDPAGLPDAPGAYAIEIALPGGLELATRQTGAVSLPAGTYLYCGSARGPGGIRARVGRHLRAEKPQRWHVDRLTAAGTVIAVRAVPGGAECALVDAALALSGASIPAPGFGSSDCRSCVAHLVALPGGLARLGATAGAPA